VNQEEVRLNRSEIVYINGIGDLGINVELRGLIQKKTPLVICKLTKGGMAYLLDDDGKYYTVPPKNVELYK